MFINFCCSCSSRLLMKSSSRRYIRTTVRLLSRKTHYDILGLKNDCTEKEIRSAFVTLSKAYHPDTNVGEVANSKSRDKNFMQVMEAYQVLSKPHSRTNYDLSLRGIDQVNYIRKDTVYEPWRVDPNDYSEKGPNYSPYYGVQGIKKMAHWKIVIACVMFCLTGIMLQVYAITRSVTFKRDQLDRSSGVYQQHHEKVRQTAELNGNADQLEKLKLRLRTSLYDKGDT